MSDGTSDPVLELRGIERVHQRGRPGEVRVLTGADLTLRAGEVAALAAPSGAGKSTLLQIAGLLDTPDAGEVRIRGRAASGLSDRARTAVRRAEVGFVYQFHHLIRELTAEENVALPMRAAGATPRAARDRARGLLDAMGLSARAGHRPGELSGGEQQRVAVCRGLANRPALLLADEPTGNLDPETADRVFAMLLGLARDEGLAALVATHNLGLAARMDRRLTLRGGKVVEDV